MDTELLKAYFVKKKLEYKCERKGCGNNKVFVTSWFKQIPRILVFHIKRFVPKYNSYTKSHDKDAKSKNKYENVFNDADDVYCKLFDAQNQILWKTENALKVYECSTDLPLTMQEPLKKSYFDAMDDKKQTNERQKDDDDDDDITILNKNDGNHNKKIETETTSNNIPPKISESPLKKMSLSDKLSQKWADV